MWLFATFVPLSQKLQIIHGPRRWTVWTSLFFLSKFRPDLIYADCTYYALMHLISMEKSFFSRLLSLAFICQAKILDICMTYLKISMLMPYISFHNVNWFWSCTSVFPSSLEHHQNIRQFVDNFLLSVACSWFDDLAKLVY